MALQSNRRKPREDRFYPHGRIATTPEGIEEAGQRKRGRLIVTDIASARPWNVIDAMAMGQDDFRDHRDPATAEQFLRRMTRKQELLRLRPAQESLTRLHEAYLDGYHGRVT